VAHWRRARGEAAQLAESFEHLTPRESQVLAYLMQGRTVREIAAAATLSESTVRGHVKLILAKLGVSSQLAAVGLAHRVGWHGPSV
jgi:two-component system, NarL family, nitrate/nitrite response regulator NarL